MGSPNDSDDCDEKKSDDSSTMNSKKEGKEESNSWKDQCIALDLSGRWTREHSLCTGLAKGLEGRGYSKEAAEKKAAAPYVQEWTRNNEKDPLEWNVITFNTEIANPYRDVTYTVGDFEEKYKGPSILFGPSDQEGSTLKRHMGYEKCSQGDIGVALVVTTETPKGKEESKRYLNKEGQLILERKLYLDKGGDVIESKEVFERA